MAKGGQTKGIAIKQKAIDVDTVDKAALQAEVKNFASGLGLAAAGVGSGFDDSDFRPPVPGQTFKTRLTKGKDVPKPRPDAQQQRVKATGATGQQQPEVPDVVRERNWNAGVGPRPGEKQGHSLLARDSPSLWYEAADSLAPLPAPTGTAAAITEEQFEAKKQIAVAALQNEEAVFERDLGRKNGQDARWLQQVRRSGTTSDKVAALTLLLQESAVANLKSLDALLNWVLKRKGGRNVVAQAIDALKEIFLVALLPDRKLKFFEQQPLAAVPANKEGSRHLLLFYVEDCLKKRYSSFVTGLEECSRDNLEFLKDKALKAMYDLLRSKSEQEGKLLSSLVNKLGDPSRKIASKAGYLLSSLLQEHPAMKVVVVSEVQRFMFRQGLQERARYYGVVFLNQMVLSHHASQGGSDLAKRLIDIYFTLFKMILEGHIGRAAAAVKLQEAKLPAKSKDRHRDRVGGRGRGGRGRGRGKGRGGRSGSQGKPGSAPTEAPKPLAEDVDARILSAIIAGVRRAFPFVVTEDIQPLIEKHSHALFKMIHTAPFSVAVQALLLLFQLMSAQNAINDRYYRALYAVLLHLEVARSGKSPMFLSLLFKAMKADVSTKRVAAFVKRLLQVAQEQQPAFTCGCLLMVSEVLKGKPALWNSILEPEDNADDVERFQDIPDSPTHDSAAQPAEAQAAQAAAQAEAVAVRADEEEDEDDEEGDMGPSTSGREEVAGARGHSQRFALAGALQDGSVGYDMRKRQPEFSGGDRSCWWELTCLGGHVHPSVAAFARSLLAGAFVSYDGDPLRDLTLTAFLDKFVQRKPKVQAQAKGSSLMQPLLPVSKPQGPSTAQIGSEAFAAMAECDVAPDAQFFHKYYSLASVKSKGTKKKRKRDEGDSDEADEFSESDSELDDVLDAEEDFDDEEGDDAHSYADLAAAMGAPEEAESAEEEGLASESELGSDAADNEGGILDVPSDEEEDDADLALSDMNDADSLDDADNDVMSGSGSDHSDQEVDEDVNPFELAEATDSDDDMSTKGKGRKKKKNQKVAPWDDISDDSDSGEDNAAEWVMHQPSMARGSKHQLAAQTHMLRKPSKSKAKKGKKPSGGLNAFASADDYMPEIEKDLASLPADMALAKEGGASGARPRTSVNKRHKRNVIKSRSL